MVERKDRRKNRRYIASIPIKFQVQAPKSVQSCVSLGVLKNISYGGAYFTSANISLLEKGQVQKFTIISLRDTSGSAIFSGWIRVVRIDPPLPGHHYSGVALEFISGKFYGYHIK